jgi:hypothetical protein
MNIQRDRFRVARWVKGLGQRYRNLRGLEIHRDDESAEELIAEDAIHPRLESLFKRRQIRGDALIILALQTGKLQIHMVKGFYRNATRSAPCNESASAPFRPSEFATVRSMRIRVEAVSNTK